MNTALFRCILTDTENTPALRSLLRDWGFTVKGDGPASGDYMKSRVKPPDSGWTQGKTRTDKTIPFLDAEGHNRFDLLPLGEGHDLIPKPRFQIAEDDGFVQVLDNAYGGKILNVFGDEEGAADWLVNQGFPGHKEYDRYWDHTAPTPEPPLED